MKSEQVYDDWKRQRSQAEVGHDFTEKVMKQVYQYEQRRKSSLFDIQWLLEAISAHPFVKAGLVVIGAFAGLVRVAFIIRVLLLGS